MSRRPKTPDDDADDACDLGTLDLRMTARGLELRHSRTGGLVAAGPGVLTHYSDGATALAASRELDPGKEFRTLQAHLALVGWSLLADAPAGFVACRWNRAVHLADLAAVQSFAERVGAIK